MFGNLFSKKELGALAMVFLILALLTPSAVGFAPAAIAQTSQTSFPTTATTPSSTCAAQISKEESKTASTLDQAKAIAIATSSNDFVTHTAGYIPKFNSMNEIWKVDLANCHATNLLSVNVDYVLFNGKGYVKNLELTLDPQLNSVQNVTEVLMPLHTSSNSTTSSNNWAGYELTGNSFTYPNPPSTNVWEAVASWTQPSVSQPSGSNAPYAPCDINYYNGQNWNNKCDLAIWNGLEDKFGASDNALAQAGSDGIISCTSTSSSSCTTTYEFWYQSGANNAPTPCLGTGLIPGDRVQSVVNNEYSSGGPNYKYDYSVIDSRNSHSCGATVTYNSLTSPTVAAFINERATNETSNPHTYFTLASFSSDTMTGSMYYGSSMNSISIPYNSTWYNEDIMENIVSQDISLSSINSNGAFTTTYQSSLDPTISIKSYDTSGNTLTGLAAYVYDSNNNLVGSGYTPLNVGVANGGTYTVKIDSYGSDQCTSVGDYPTVTSYTAYSWGCQSTISVPSSGAVTVNGYYGTNSGSSNNLQVSSADLNDNSLTGFYIQLDNSGGTQIGSGYTTVTFTGLSGSGTQYKVYANSYCNSSTHTNYTPSRWGDGTTGNEDTISMNYNTNIKVYYSTSSC